MQTLSSESLVAGLREKSAYSHPVAGSVAVQETHISWIFLAGDYVYKIKKPLRTDFLDYASLEARQQACHQELQLNRRFAPDLYLDVVAISIADGQPKVGGGGEAVEYAVKMRRFPDDALLGRRLLRDALSTDEVHQLARTVAELHGQAARADRTSRDPWGSPQRVRHDAMATLQEVRASHRAAPPEMLDRVEQWMTAFCDTHAPLWERRVAEGFIRECHGDLHVANVVHWQNRWVPFDGIEFNERFRWIDVLSDAAFLVMDFAAQGHPALSRSFTSAYLEQTGDYGSLQLLRWYLVYRALVRAMVAAMRAGQDEVAAVARVADLADCDAHVELAYRYTVPDHPRLWITHGVSGSGKTTGSEQVVERHGAIRLRSDIERKRLHGLDPIRRPTAEESAELYSGTATEETYDRLCRCAGEILRAGYAVIVDATFLERKQRQRFHKLAATEGVPYTILDFQAAESVLRQRVADRATRGTDASDADLEVLERQIARREPLAEDERQHAVLFDGLEN